MIYAYVIYTLIYNLTFNSLSFVNTNYMYKLTMISIYIYIYIYIYIMIYYIMGNTLIFYIKHNWLHKLTII